MESNHSSGRPPQPKPDFHFSKCPKRDIWCVDWHGFQTFFVLRFDRLCVAGCARCGDADGILTFSKIHLSAPHLQVRATHLLVPWYAFMILYFIVRKESTTKKSNTQNLFKFGGAMVTQTQFHRIPLTQLDRMCQIRSNFSDCNNMCCRPDDY